MASKIGALRVRDVTIDEDSLVPLIRRAKGGRGALKTVRLPSKLNQRLPEFGPYFQARDPESRLIAPLALGCASTDAIFARIRYRLKRIGVHWSPLQTCSTAARQRSRAGVDRAEISGGLGHVLVQTAATAYVALDPMDIAVNERKHAGHYPTPPFYRGHSVLAGERETAGGSHPCCFLG